MTRPLDEVESIEKVADQFDEGSVVPVLGAGCSASAFPTAKQFAQLMHKKYPRLTLKSDTFYDVTQLLDYKRGRNKLLEELRSEYSPAKSLPVYNLLAKLPVDTVVSFNFDESFEYSLRNAGISYTCAVSDSGVASSRNGHVMVVKPHGTIEQPDTLRTTRKDIAAFDYELPLMRSLLEVLLAERHLLLLGYSFADHDVVTAINRVQRWTRRSFRGGTAIIQSPSRSLRAELQGMGFSIIDGDAERILTEISFVYATQDDRQVDVEKWRAHPFFADILEIRSRPTETQMLDSLIESTERYIRDGSFRQPIQWAAEAAELCLQYRGNYASATKVAESLKQIAESPTDNDARERWDDYKQRRRLASQSLSRQAQSVLDGKPRLLLYAQSQRVINLLMDQGLDCHDEMTLYISECRHKSTTPYMNVRLIAEKLRGNVRNGRFKSIRHIDDMAALHLICDGNVDGILMGVHNVFWSSNGRRKSPFAVVNSVGTQAVCMAAKAGNVPVIFVYESEKITRVKSVIEARSQFLARDRQRSWTEVQSSSCESLQRLSVGQVQIDYDFVLWDKDFMQAVQEESEP